jgi:sarcosine oxidase
VAGAEVIVVGLGAMGAAITWQLAKRGARVLGLDRFTPPHDRGSSHGETRITRRIVGEGAEYVGLVQRSHALWRELEAAPGELFAEVGCLTLARRGGAAQRHGGENFLAQTLDVARRCGLDPQLIEADELRRRYPQFLVSDDTVGFLDDEAGFLRPERCIAAELAAAVRAGAQLRLGETVTAIERDGAGLVVATDKGRHTAARVVIAAGAWLPGLLGRRYAARLSVYPQAAHWFAADEPALWERSPVFLWFHGDAPTDVFYGFPTAPGGLAGVKIATEQFEVTASPDAPAAEVSQAESAGVFARHAAGRLRGVTSRRLAASRCLYTFNAPHGRFLIGPDPEMPRVTVVSACSGHGFKHSAAIGEAVAQTLVGGASDIDLTPFEIA